MDIRYEQLFQRNLYKTYTRTYRSLPRLSLAEEVCYNVRRLVEAPALLFIFLQERVDNVVDRYELGDELVDLALVLNPPLHERQRPVSH